MVIVRQRDRKYVGINIKVCHLGIKIYRRRKREAVKKRKGNKKKQKNRERRNNDE